MYSSINSFFSWVSGQGIRPGYSLGKAKYIKLVNQLSMLVAAICLLLIAFSYPGESIFFKLLKWVAPLMFLSNIYVNRFGYPKTAKVALYLELNAYSFCMVLMVGGLSGAHLFFIPIIFGSALVFDMRRLSQRVWVLIVPTIMLLSLWFIGNAYSPDVLEFNSELHDTYIFHYLLTVLVSFLLAYLYFRITHQQQQELSNAIRQLEDLNVALVEKERTLEHNLQYSDLLLENLKASKDYFKSVIQNASDIICITDGKGNIKFLTPSFYRLTGYSQQAIRNQSVFEFIHPDDITTSQERFFLKLGKADQGSDPYMFRFRKQNGEYLYLEATGTNLLDNKAVSGIVVNARDITERVRFQQELIRNEKNIRSILDNSPATIWLVDRNYHLIDYNLAFEAFMQTQYGIEPVSGLNMQTVFTEDIVKEWDQRYKAAAEGKDNAYFEEVEINGRPRTFQVKVYPILKDGEVDRFTVFAEDITLQKKAEQALIEAKDKAEEATRIKAQFLSTMSHEIRTPMNAVIGMTHLLMQEDPRPDQHESLRLLRFSAENLLTLINDILDYNKIEAGKINFESTPFDLPQLVSDLKSSLLSSALEKGISLEVLHDAALPKMVMGDPVRLSQVLTNLLSNAIKFTPKGRVRIQTNLIKEEAESCQISFRVEDTGIGIAADKLELIFESFSQAEADTTRRFGGTGLGLSISKRLLELQGSQITVESEPGQGSVFSFVLSFAKPSLHATPMQNIQLKPVESFENIRVLLVEDNPLNRFVAEKFLTRWGLVLDVAETGAEALKFLQQEQYGMVLMDLQLPDIDGFEVVEKLRASSFINAAVPVVAMSASTEPHVQAQAFASGMQDFVVKPFNPEELRQKIYAILGATPQMQVVN